MSFFLLQEENFDGVYQDENIGNLYFNIKIEKNKIFISEDKRLESHTIYKKGNKRYFF